jgi:heme/copper-type cytochrome/quinol oxidase subunit 2
MTAPQEPQGSSPVPADGPAYGQQYGQPYGPGGHAPANGLGTAALVLGIVGLLLFWTVIGGIVLGILALIFGIIGRGRAKRGEATNGGVATAGLVLGAVAIVVSIAYISLVGAFFLNNGGKDLVDCTNKAGNDQAAVQRCNQQFQDKVNS